MPVGKRPEVLVLLALVVLGGAWVAWQQWRGPQPAGAASGAGALQVTVTAARVMAEGDYLRVRVEFTVTHLGTAPLSARPPHVKLLDDQGREVTPFFVPGEFPPDLPARRTGASWFEGWLTAEQATGPLTLEVAGRQVAVPLR